MAWKYLIFLTTQLKHAGLLLAPCDDTESLNSFKIVRLIRMDFCFDLLPVGLLIVAQRKELLPGLGIIAEHAEHRGGDRLAVDLLDAPHDHAHVAVGRNEGKQKKML